MVARCGYGFTPTRSAVAQARNGRSPAMHAGRAWPTEAQRRTDFPFYCINLITFSVVHKRIRAINAAGQTLAYRVDASSRPNSNRTDSKRLFGWSSEPTDKTTP